MEEHKDRDFGAYYLHPFLNPAPVIDLDYFISTHGYLCTEGRTYQKANLLPTTQTESA